MEVNDASIYSSINVSNSSQLSQASMIGRSVTTARRAFIVQRVKKDLEIFMGIHWWRKGAGDLQHHEEEFLTLYNIACHLFLAYSAFYITGLIVVPEDGVES